MQREGRIKPVKHEIENSRREKNSMNKEEDRTREGRRAEGKVTICTAHFTRSNSESFTAAADAICQRRLLFLQKPMLAGSKLEAVFVDF